MHGINVAQIPELGSLDQDSHTNKKRARDYGSTESTKTKRLRTEADAIIFEDNAETSLYEEVAIEHDPAISFANGDELLPEIDMHFDDSGINNNSHEGVLQELVEGHSSLNLPQRVPTPGSPLLIDLNDRSHDGHEHRTMLIVDPTLEPATKVQLESLSDYKTVSMTTPAINKLQHSGGSNVVAPGFSVIIPSNKHLQLPTMVFDTGAEASQAAMTLFHNDHGRTGEAEAQMTDEMKPVTWDDTEDTLIMQMEDNWSVDGDIGAADGGAARLDAISISSSVGSPSSSGIMSKSDLDQAEVSVAAETMANPPTIPAHQALLQEALHNITQVCIPKLDFMLLLTIV